MYWYITLRFPKVSSIRLLYSNYHDKLIKKIGSKQTVCHWQAQWLEEQSYELSVCIDFYVYAGAFLHFQWVFYQCRNPPLSFVFTKV